MDAENGERPPYAVAGGRNNSEQLFVCRAGDHQQFPGQLSWEGCMTTAGGGGWRPRLFHHYQVLVNEDGSARLEWASWRQFTSLSPGAVNIAPEIYVAREQVEGPSFQGLGGLHLHQQYGLIVVPPSGKKLTSGNLNFCLNRYSLKIKTIFLL